MPRLILLARHGTHAEVGHVLSGRSEIALSPQGREEASTLARHLAPVRLATVHASPRRRTQETAAAVAGARGLPVVTASALDEIDFGAFTGKAFAALDQDAAWQKWNAARGTARCPGGETMAEAVARALDYVAAIPATDTPALCVTHCDVIRGVVAHVLGLGFERIFQLGCDPAAVTTLAFEADAVSVVAMNERPFVPPLQGEVAAR